MALITPKQLRLATLKLEIESANHVIAVLSQQYGSSNKNKNQIDEEVAEWDQIRRKLADEMFELEILVGGE